MSDHLALPDLSDTRVLVLGDVMLDQYWFGNVERISPEAPVPIVSVNHGDRRGGGAANVALNVVSLGAQCTLLSICGDDAYATELEQLLTKQNIEVNFLKSQNYDTTVKQRVISRNQQLIRLDFERRPDSELLDRLDDEFNQLIGSYDCVIFSDYGKGCLENVSDMINQSKTLAIPVCVDPKGKNYSRYRHASLITPNLNEFEQVVGEVNSDNELDEKAKILVGELSIDQLLVTLSEKGMKLFTKDNEIHYSPAHVQEVYDVSGAGDTVIACLGTLLTTDLELEDVLEIANAAAGVVVAKLGTAVADIEEITNALIQNGSQP